jgi:hypothetical protein
VSELPVPHQRLLCVQSQINDLEKGLRETLACPYCGTVNVRGQICCETLAKAVAAVLDANDLARNLATADAIFHRIN